jgi:hypothetical protein
MTEKVIYRGVCTRSVLVTDSDIAFELRLTTGEVVVVVGYTNTDDFFVKSHGEQGVLFTRRQYNKIMPAIRAACRTADPPVPRTRFQIIFDDLE